MTTPSTVPITLPPTTTMPTTRHPRQPRGGPRHANPTAPITLTTIAVWTTITAPTVAILITLVALLTAT